MRLYDFEQIENDVLFDLYRALSGRENRPCDNEILSILYAIADYRTLDSIRASNRRKRRSFHSNAGLGIAGEIEDPCPSPAHAVEVQDLLRSVLDMMRPRVLQIVQLWIDGETTKSISMSIGLGIRSVERELREFRTLVDAMTRTNPKRHFRGLHLNCDQSQGKARQGKAKQNETKRNETKRNKTRQDKTRQDKTSLGTMGATRPM